MTDDDLDQIIMAVSAAGAAFRGSHVEVRHSLRTAAEQGYIAFTGKVPEREPDRVKPDAYTAEGQPIWKR